jgi:hypothetical protein
MSALLRMWTVYKHPKDYPNSYVARLFEVDANGARPTPSIIVAPDLERLRDTLQFDMDLVKLMRSPEDDPVIVETWL